MCQVCKLKLLFWTSPIFWTIFLLLDSYLKPLLNIFYHRSTGHCIRNCNFYHSEIADFFFFFFYQGFLSQPFTNHGTAGEGEGISLATYYHFHPLHRYLDISRENTAESSLLHSRTRTRNLWFPSARKLPNPAIN